MAMAVFAQTEHTDTERRVKAAYLYKFGGYVEWPGAAFATPNAPIQIGIIGSSELADELAQVVLGRIVNGRQVAIRKLKADDSLEGLNVLFIGSSSNDKLEGILKHAKGMPILTVTEATDGLALGSIINFVIVEGKLRFEISPKAANLNNLSISARLLVAAYKVMSG